MAVSRRLRFEILRRDGHTCRYCGSRAPEVQLTVDHVVPVTLGGSDEPSNLVAACTSCNAGKSSVPAGAPLVDQVTEDALRWSRAMVQAAEEFAAEREVVDVLIDEWREVWDRWTYPVEVTVPPPPAPKSGDPIRDTWYGAMGYLGGHSSPLLLADGVLMVTAERGYTPEVRSAAERALRQGHWEDVAVTSVVVKQGVPDPPPPPGRPTKKTERRQIPLDSDWRESIGRFISLGLSAETMDRFVETAMVKRGLAKEDVFRYFCGCCWNHLADLQESARRILESGQT